MSWFFTVLFFISLIFNNTPSEASHEKQQHPSAVVVGTVFCDTCFQQDFSHSSHFISGASVGVECKDGASNSKPSFQTQVKTDSHGAFKVHLPFSVSKHVKKIEGCSVELISSNEPYCAVASTATSSSLHLKSRKQGTHIFSAGFFTFKPLKQPSLCNQKPSIQNSDEISSQKFPFPPTDDLAFPSPNEKTDLSGRQGLPGLPGLPGIPAVLGVPIPGLPGVPVLPPIPGKTTAGSNSKTSKTRQLNDKKVAQPNTFLPIPRIPGLPPNPFQPPQCVPSIPNPFQPPPAPLIPSLPPPAGLTPPAGPTPLIPNLPPPGLIPPAGPTPLIPNSPPPGLIPTAGPPPSIPNLPPPGLIPPARPTPLIPNSPPPGLIPPAGPPPSIPNLPPPGLIPPAVPPPSIPNLPPVPGLTPPPSFPLPPAPRIPGIPPSSSYSSSSKQTTSP